MTLPEKNKEASCSPTSGSVRSGFTLLEILIAMAIFLIVIVVVAQIFSAGMGGVKRLFGRQNALDAARFVLESMSKEIRMSDVLTGAGGPSASINIKNSKDCYVTYAFSGTVVTREVTSGAGCTVGVLPVELTPDEVEITGSFWINIAATEQARVTVTMNVKNKTTILTQQVQVNLQTTISSRQYAP
ncbi:prepilin-type N-terminal cleavage/methylation domain-containing protein [Patescibacteria group bacterium]|nr:prepilin-type N-terminal cleavage/methylation domain-containing protein [Patescibacteria group bacterium]